jgi:hypothetical protein
MRVCGNVVDSADAWLISVIYGLELVGMDSFSSPLSRCRTADLRSDKCDNS